LIWIHWKTDFKLREPKKDWVYSFRINKQFRAFSYLKNNDLIVYKIDNHQN
jgi:plasmid maintenance system killer protein